MMCVQMKRTAKKARMSKMSFQELEKKILGQLLGYQWTTKAPRLRSIM